eukprot:m.24847 g.24847  ORF g.24847 m.24847 type:complete len:386 (+) comp7651_c0_seq2:243-1400(+)
MGSAESRLGSDALYKFGRIPAREAEEILRGPEARPGDFLIRESYSVGGYCLSIRVNHKEVKHFPITERKNKFNLNMEWHEGTLDHLKFDPSNKATALQFESVRELLLAFMRSGPKAKIGYAHFGCFLLRPVPRPETGTKMPDFARARFGGTMQTFATGSPSKRGSDPTNRESSVFTEGVALLRRESRAPTPDEKERLARRARVQSTPNFMETNNQLPGQLIQPDQSEFEKQRLENARLRQRQSMMQEPSDEAPPPAPPRPNRPQHRSEAEDAFTKPKLRRDDSISKSESDLRRVDSMEEGMGFDDDASVASFDAGAEGVYDNNAEFLNSAPPSKLARADSTYNTDASAEVTMPVVTVMASTRDNDEDDEDGEDGFGFSDSDSDGV